MMNLAVNRNRVTEAMDAVKGDAADLAAYKQLAEEHRCPESTEGESASSPAGGESSHDEGEEIIM